jgi:ABC-type Zn uptake system ZnuABC Zn-binding protein ZnuA
MGRMRAGMVPVVVAVVALAACGGDDTSNGGSGDGLRVVTTVAPITSIVAAVGGEHVDVVGLVPEGTNSHTFEPPPSAAATLAEADVLFVNGLDLEDPTQELAESNLPDGAELVALGEHTITEDDYIYDFSFPEEGGKPNPHLWTNPPMARRYGEIVRDTLSERDPDHAAAYAANLEAYAEQVDALDDAMAAATGTVPADQRTLLTYHDAYAYFAEHYGWDVVGAIQPSDFAEPSPRDIADLVRQIEDEGVPAIFGSEVFPSPVLDQLSEETGVEYVDDLRDDDLPGEPGDEEHTLLGLLRFNFVTMVDALGGDPSALEALDLTPTVDDPAEYPQ